MRKHFTLVSLAVVQTFFCLNKSVAQHTYWQQEVNYTIHVSLDDVNNFLNGDISMVYTNHSPDTLHYIWMHLWPNAYRNENTAFAKQMVENGSTGFLYSTEKERGYIDSISFQVNNQFVKLDTDVSHIDYAKMELKTPLLPNQSITIATPFRVKIPYTFSRMGHIGQQYQISQWYPKPAVYDQRGWHPLPYLDQGEFYSEYGSFDVYITLPKNYVVGATGYLQNVEEKKWMDEKAGEGEKKFSADSISISINTKEGEPFPPSDSTTKTLHYVANKVHDFAWFTDKRYNVMKSSVALPSGSVVTTWALFTNAHSNVWKKAVQYADSGIYYYSKWIGDYPYNVATVVDGALSAGGGMEYPMITVISGNNSAIGLDDVIAHELGHNWFYGVLGFNEREHPWMDEGINTYYENRYIDHRYPDSEMLPSFISKPFDLDQYPRTYSMYLLYYYLASLHIDQPMDINASKFTGINYGGIVYAKTGVVFKYLQNYLGTTTYDSIMHSFYRQWQFKHPYPDDLEILFNDESNKELDWFFKQIIQTTDQIDFKLVKQDENKTIGHSDFNQLLVANKAEVKGPFSISALKDHKPVSTIWYNGFDGKMNVLFPKGDYDAFRIDNDYNIPEVNRSNNTLRTHGLFKHIEPLRLQFFGSIDNPERTQLFFTPALGYNQYDGFMLGLALYNSFIPSKKLEVQLLPMYAFATKNLTGLGNIAFNIFPKSESIQHIQVFASVKSFCPYVLRTPGFLESNPDSTLILNLNYIRIKNGVEIDLKKKEARSPVDQRINFLNYPVYTQTINVINDSTFDKMWQHVFYNAVEYHYSNSRKVDPFRYTVRLEQGQEIDTGGYLNATVTANFHISYPQMVRGIDIRLFGGMFLYKNNLSPVHQLHLSPTTGGYDYLYDEYYFGRNEVTGFWSQQIAVEEGGFKMRQTGLQPQIGSSDKWIAAMNIKVPFPKLLPVFGFADVGLAPNTTYSTFQYDAGIGATLIPGLVEVYWPIALSDDLKLNLNSLPFYDTWYKKISFTFNLNMINPWKQIRELKIG